MSNASQYSESFLSEQSEIPGAKLIENLRNEMESNRRQVTGKIRFLQTKISDAEEKIAEYKELENKVGELENKVETQELKIDHLERMLEEKIVENEIQRVTIDKTVIPVPISKTPSKIVSQRENFGLSEGQLKALSEYGAIGHLTDEDVFSEDDGGFKQTDKTCFALLIKAIRNGLTLFTLKDGKPSHEYDVGNAKFTYLSEEKESEDGVDMWIKKFSITLDGRPVRFKARCYVMDALAGYEKKKYEFKKTNSDGFYEQVILGSDWEEGGSFYTRYNLTIIE